MRLMDGGFTHIVGASCVRTAESAHVSCTEDAMLEQSQVRDGLEITSPDGSFDPNHASHVCGNNMRRSSRAKAPTRRKRLSPAGHIREYSRVLSTKRAARPRSDTSGCQSAYAAEARHVATAGWSILPSRCDEDSAFACRSMAGGNHEAKRRGRFQSAPAGETWRSNRGLGGRKRPIFSSCVGRRRRREPLASRLLREPRGVSAATGMVAHLDLLSHHRVRWGRCRPRTRIRDWQNPCQSHRECERKSRCESRSRIGDANLHLRYAGVWRAAYHGCHWNIWPH